MMFARSKGPIWRCDDCGGLANWTIIDGGPYYACQQGCGGFLQGELFETWEPEAEDRVVTPEGAAADEHYEETELEDGLPF